MRKINVRKGSQIIILDGPSLLGIEHSLFDEQVRDEPPKKVRITYQHIETAEEDYILKFDNLKSEIMEVVVVAVCRPRNDKDKNLILWCYDRGLKLVLYYSPGTRLGCGKPSKFPEY